MPVMKCSLCSRTYSKAEHLKRHQRSHTKERPYQCTLCKKFFSRSDVLRRHQKNHPKRPKSRGSTLQHNIEQCQDSAEAATLIQPNSNALTPSEDIRQSVISLGGSDVALQQIPRKEVAHTSDAAEQYAFQQGDLELPDQANLNRLEQSRNSRNIMNSEIIIADVRSSDLLKAQTQQLELPPSKTYSNIIPLQAVGESEHNQPYSADSQFAYQIDHSVELLDSWLFQCDPGSMLTPLPDLLPALHLPTLTNTIYTENFGFAPGSPNNVEANMDPSNQFAALVSQERFEKIQSHWQSRSSRATRLMPSLWQDLAASERKNLYCKQVSEPVSDEVPRKRVSRWGFDDECRQQMQLTLNSLTQVGSNYSPQSIDSFDCDNASRSCTTASYTGEDITLPSTETCEVALEIYFHQFHPTLPVIHLPTFCTKGAPFPLLFVLCLLGFSILGTPSATKLVANSFPMVIQIVSAELQANTARRGSPDEQLTLIVTALLALNLASVTGVRNMQNPRRMAQAEMLYVNLISIAQWHGLFFADGEPSITRILESITDVEEKWQAWTKFESIKRLVIGLVEIDDWFASYFSVCPIIRSESTQLLPPSDNKLFHASTASTWMQLIQSNSRIHVANVAAVWNSSPKSLDPSILPTLLVLLRHRTYEANHRLINSREQNYTITPLEPWKMYMEDTRDRMLVSSIAVLPSTSANPLKTADINGVISWHTSCMMLTANMQLFEDATGRHGSAAVPASLQHIANWASTPTARRAVIHAAQVFKLLFHRKVSDVISVHTVAALFKSALILSFYLLTASKSSHSTSDAPLELHDEINWSGIGLLGMSDDADPDSRIGNTPLRDPVSTFVKDGGAFSITGIVHTPGYSSCRRVLLHSADLMQTLGKWKSRMFSQILHLLTDDLMDIDAADVGD